MASFTLTRTDKFPSGTSVSAYPRSNWLQSRLPPSGSPQGSSTTSATATAAGVAFTGLADSTQYYAYAQVAGVDTYVGFTTDAAAAGSAASDRTVYLKDYGATFDGVTDNASALTAAATAMVAQGRRRLHLGEGDVFATAWPTALNSIARLAIVGEHPEGSRLLVGGWSGFNAFIKPAGTYGAAITLTADAAQYATTLALPTTGLAAGDTLLLGANTAFSTENPTRYKGEQVRVKSIDSGSALTIHGWLRDAYTVAASASAQKITPLVGLHLANFTLVNTAPGTNTAKGIELDAVQRFHVENVHTEGIDGAGLALTNCLDGATRTQHRDHTDDAGNSRFGYGTLTSRATQDVECDIVARNVRHAFTADAIDSARGVVRAVTVTGIAEACTSGAWDTHATSEGIIFKAVVARGCQYHGVQLRGKRCRVLGADFAFCNVGVIISDDADGSYVGGGTTIRDIQDGNSQGSGIRIAAPADVTIDGFQIERIGRRGIHIAGAAARLKIRNGVVANTGVANVSGFKSGIATDSGLTNATSGLEIERILFVRDSGVAPNMDAGIKQQSTGWTGGRFADIVAHSTTPLSDSATVPNEQERIYRLDEKTPANFPNGVTIKSKSGVVTDADWPVAPANGTVALQRKKLVRRVAGIWESDPTDAAQFWMPTNAVVETYSRRGARAGDNCGLLSSGRLQLIGGMLLPADKTITNLVAYSGTTAGATMTNQWFCLVDAVALTVLAITVDDTSTAWAANSKKLLALAATYTPTADTPAYFGIMVAGTTVPTLLGSSQSASNVVAEGRAMVGASTTGLTSPLAVGASVSGPSSSALGLPYCYAT